jgi:hypothetical protein
VAEDVVTVGDGAAAPGDVWAAEYSWKLESSSSKTIASGSAVAGIAVPIAGDGDAVELVELDAPTMHSM